MRVARPIFYTAIALLSAALTWVLTGPWIITPHYKSETIIYVPLTIPSKQIEQQGIGFASDREIDGHIQILKSGLLLDSLIHRYDLATKFNIDTGRVGALAQLHHSLASRISIEKTRYNSVSIVVKDENPVQAATMANAIVRLGDEIKEGLLKGNRRDALNYSRMLFETKEAEVLALEQKIDSLQSAGRERRITQTSLDRLRALYTNELQELAGRKNHLEREQKNFETTLPASYVITQAYPASKPSWPPRLLLSLLAAAAVLAISLIINIVTRSDA